MLSQAEKEAVAWLKLWDKHLWGINASYAEAAKMLGDPCISAKTLTDLLYDVSVGERVDDAGEVHKVTTRTWRGTLLYWKCPDMMSGPRSATKKKSLGRKRWDDLKALVARTKAMLMEKDTTVAFAIRHMRSNWLPANAHIVSELFTLKHIPMREVPDESV